MSGSTMYPEPAANTKKRKKEKEKIKITDIRANKRCTTGGSRS